MICAVTTMQHPAVTLTLKELKVDRLIKVESVLGFFALNFFVIKSILLRDGLHFNFHYPNYRYITSVLLLQAAGRQYSVSLWGSDYLKVTGWRRIILGIILRGASRVSLASSALSYRLIYDHGLEKERVFTIPFLIPNLSSLYNRAKESSLTCEGRDRVFKILCGTNGSENQQFDLIFSALKLIEDVASDSVELHFHFSYGVADSSKVIIDRIISETRYRVVVNSHYLTGEELIAYRLGMDVLIQVQKTDQLSAAMLEHLVQGKPVITGEWLEYSALDENKISVFRIPSDSSGCFLAEAILYILKHKLRFVEGNGERVNSYFGDEVSLERWREFFDLKGL